MIDDRVYLSIEEVAKRFGVNSSTVYHLSQTGKLPGFKIGGQWRFSQDVLKSWVDSQLVAQPKKSDVKERSKK